MYYLKSSYRFLYFEKSKRRNKKYDAVLKKVGRGNVIRIPFGDERYQQYEDTTGLGEYTHLDHLDKKRRISYMKRHSGFIQKDFYSPGYYSMKYLW